MHALHRTCRPAALWHQRPRRFRERQNEVFTWNGGYRYRGYGEIVVRHFLHPKGATLSIRSPTSGPSRVREFGASAGLARTRHGSTPCPLEQPGRSCRSIR